MPGRVYGSRLPSPRVRCGMSRIIMIVGALIGILDFVFVFQQMRGRRDKGLKKLQSQSERPGNVLLRALEGRHSALRNHTEREWERENITRENASHHPQQQEHHATPTSDQSPLISILASTGPSRVDFFMNLWGSFKRQRYANKEMIVFEDSEDEPSDFWRNISDSRVRYIHVRQSRGSRMGIGTKHERMMRLARGQYMAVFDDDDYYSPEYLSFMLSALRRRDVSLVKLGSWPIFDARWQGAGSERKLLGSFWHFNVTGSDVELGFGFSYFFSRRCAAADVRITHAQTHDWDSQWLIALIATGLRAAVVDAHPLWLVIKVQHSDNISRPNSQFLRRLRATYSVCVCVCVWECAGS